MDEWLGRAGLYWEVPGFYLRVGLAGEAVDLSRKGPKHFDTPGVGKIVENLLPVDRFAIVVQGIDALEGVGRVDSANVVSQRGQTLNFSEDFIELCHASPLSIGKQRSQFGNQLLDVWLIVCSQD